MKSAKPAIIIPPVSQRKTTKSGKRMSSADSKNKFSASGTQFTNNDSQLSQNSNSSKNGKKDKLNNSLEEKKKRLSQLQKLLKQEKVVLKEEYASEEEEDFQYTMKETAFQEFQKQVNKQALLEDVTELDPFKNSTTIKKEQLQAQLLFANQSLQDTVNFRQDIPTKENSNDKYNEVVAKNPRPKRETSNTRINNFIQEEEEEQPEQKQAVATPAQVQPKRDFSKKRVYTAKQKSTFRMYVQRKKYLQEKKRLELLLQEHRKELVQKRVQNEQEQVNIEQGKSLFAGRHIIQFQGIDKLLQNSQVLKNQALSRASKKRTHSEGPFSLYEQMKQNEEQGNIDQENEGNRSYKLYQSKYNPLRKSRPPLPTKVPLNNNFFSDKGIVDCFVKKNRSNLPIALKKSSSSGESYNLSTLPEYQELLQKSKQAIRQPLVQQKQQKQEEDSVIYSDTFEKESIEMSPVQKKFQFNKSTPQKRNSIHSVSEEDYLRESFEIDTPKESIKESIRESFNKDSNRFQSSFSMQGKIHEDIPEESMMAESINESSIVDETEPQRNKKKNNSIQEDIIQTSIEDDYQNEKFESISEDFNNSEQKSMIRESIGEDIAGMSFESKGKRGKKKSVTFSKEKSEQIQKQLTGASQNAATVSQFSKETIHNNNSGILRRSTDSLNAEQMVQISQKSNYSSSQKLKDSNMQATLQQIQEMYFGKEGVSDTWKKFEKIRNNYDDKTHSIELNKEQMELGKLQKDIYSMLQNTKSLADKWQEERDNLLTSDSNASKKAEMVYQKYQSEFNRILQSAPMLNRFSLLKNYLEYRDRQMKNINLFKENIKPSSIQQDTAAMIQKEVQSQMENMVKNLEQKQEIMYKVLVQVVENLQNLRNPSFEFDNMKKMQGIFEGKIDSIFANQEKILKFQFEQEMVFRQDQLKLLYSSKPITEEELKLIRIRQLLSQNRSEQIIPFINLDNVNFVPNVVVQGGQQQQNQQINLDDKNRLKDISLSSSIDMEAMNDSKISWQSGQEIWDNLNEREKEKLNDFNTEQVVNFLSEMLMQEIEEDLFPMRMTTSHLQLKKNDKLIQDRAMEKISPPKQHSQQQADKKAKIQSSLQSTMSPVINKSNSQQKLKSERTLTEESKYESDFEDSEDKFGQSLQSNRSNNKSLNFEDSDVSATKNKLSTKESQEKLNNKSVKDDYEDKVSEQENEEDLEYENDFEDSVEKSTTQVSKNGQLQSVQSKNENQKQDDDFDDPMGITSKAIDRNALLAEINENDKKNPSSAPLPKLSGQAKKVAPKSKQLDDEDYRGDNDFFKPQVEDENGNLEKNPNKDLYKNQQTYEKTNRILNNLKTSLKKKKKLKIIKDIIDTISQNNVKGKKIDQFIGNILKDQPQFQLFESSECKNEDEKVIGQAYLEQFYNNLIKNIQDLEQFHFNQAFNRKEIQAEIVVRWDHICEVATQQTLQILEKVVPVDYYSDVKIDKYTPYKKVKRFCTINKVAKEDNELFELQNYELYKEEVNYQKELSDQVLQNIVKQLAKDLISIQNKQKQKM